MIYVSVVQLQARGPHIVRHTAFAVARGSIQEKPSHLKFIKKCVRVHFSHWIAFAG